LEIYRLTDDEIWFFIKNVNILLKFLINLLKDLLLNLSILCNYLSIFNPFLKVKNIIFNMGNKEKWRLILDHF